MVTAQDKPRSRLEEAPPTQCPRCTTPMKVQVRSSPWPQVPRWTTAATDAEQRSCELCRVSAKGWLQPSRQQRARRFLRP
jgi:hypothetical protein